MATAHKRVIIVCKKDTKMALKLPKMAYKPRVALVTTILFVAIISLVGNYYNTTEVGNSLLRRLSVNLGGGKCIWSPPIYDVPNDLNFTKLLIAGYPSGDKRMTFVQMEALTGLSARDEWDFQYLGMTNQPFIKANYPHHEGIWGWEGAADNVIMIVRNIRRSMTEYHDILWDIGYAKTWDVASENIDKLYAERPPKEDFFEWRDLRVLDEIQWYGWFIDFYMEGGLMRDMFTHKITTPEHWYMLMRPEANAKAEMTYDLIVGPDTVVTPSYDPHCVHDIGTSCKPIEVISAEKLIDHNTGRAESRKLAKILQSSAGYGDWLIEEEAWECIWEELIVKKKGLKTFIDREGTTERDYNFSEEMLTNMIKELTRLITKYGPNGEYANLSTAQYLVQLLTEHRSLIQIELNEVLSGARKLKSTDFLGAATRKDLSNPPPLKDE